MIVWEGLSFDLEVVEDSVIKQVRIKDVGGEKHIFSKKEHNAPQDFQDGRIGRVVDYCLADVRSTLALYRYLVQNGGIKDPRSGEWIAVTVPKWLPINTTHNYQPKDDTQ